MWCWTPVQAQPYTTWSLSAGLFPLTPVKVKVCFSGTSTAWLAEEEKELVCPPRDVFGMSKLFPVIVSGWGKVHFDNRTVSSSSFDPRVAGRFLSVNGVKGLINKIPPIYVFHPAICIDGRLVNGVVANEAWHIIPESGLVYGITKNACMWPTLGYCTSYPLPSFPASPGAFLPMLHSTYSEEDLLGLKSG